MTNQLSAAMSKKIPTCKVKSGRVRVICSRCDKIRYIAAPYVQHLKTVRCTCGMSAVYALNYREFARETFSGRASIILQNGKEWPVYLSDISIGGIGFIVPQQHRPGIPVQHNFGIKFRSDNGSIVQRKICIRNRVSNRFGAVFLDGIVPSSI
jgi:hypothetical protein